MQKEVGTISQKTAHKLLEVCKEVKLYGIHPYLIDDKNRVLNMVTEAIQAAEEEMGQ